MTACHCECSTGVGALEKKILRKCKKPLDNFSPMWYNTGGKERWKPLPICGSSGERSRKKM